MSGSFHDHLDGVVADKTESMVINKANFGNYFLTVAYSKATFDCHL